MSQPNIYYVLLKRLRVPLITLILIYAVSIVGFVLIPGQDNEGHVWMMSYFHAFYFVSYMASTIGFGEIPYAFTDAQRMWTTVTIYASVIGWLYSIGSLLSVMQDPAIERLRRESKFRNKVKLLREPFYLVCGYGDTGTRLVHALGQEGVRTVVLDKDENRINELEMRDTLGRPLGLTADAAKPAVLGEAGVLNIYCKGVIALTDSDQANLLISLSTELFKPHLRLIARAESPEFVNSISSFGNNEVISPFEVFAERLEMLMTKPSHYLLNEWLTGIPNQLLHDPVFPKKGAWVLIGYGRFGQAVYRRLHAAGIPVQVIDPKPGEDALPEQSLIGLQANRKSLQLANIESAVGLIAATSDDATNLSVLMTARELNPNLFMVARQNQQDNNLIFERAQFHLTMNRGDVVAHQVFTLLRTPLTRDFLRLAQHETKTWVDQLLSRIISITEDKLPYLWETKITPRYAPALYSACAAGAKVSLKYVIACIEQREHTLPIIPLLLKRVDTFLLVPDGETLLQAGDRILMCAPYHAYEQMQWATQNQKVLHYLLTGEEWVSSILLRRLLPNS
ncbi:TrkA family potassium uptake protein [uncultured Thiothrix sp.]|uniref:potassium channel family protein n=1 Tax=uncultured Thiothrix sp. TaxID=223185 RepID=UPI00262C65CB|nr:NAD-binding protein [uncultured Thiothrix sp.]